MATHRSAALGWTKARQGGEERMVRPGWATRLSHNSARLPETPPLHQAESATGAPWTPPCRRLLPSSWSAYKAKLVSVLGARRTGLAATTSAGASPGSKGTSSRIHLPSSSQINARPTLRQVVQAQEA
ncbi:hypothetical protein GWK47_039026 [Chionoecetes opilio]|uniref:Uncharacterized protein n=1 Tax=Chionoecetes opilio TaxID=41210 RepID=A0A8J5D1J2_CHIOP|nr:hypothetical protein GWK47_039026 [Chionoecetes opilio]